MIAQRVFVGLLAVFGLAILGADVSGAVAQGLPAAIYRGYAPGPPNPPYAQLTHPGTYSQTYNDITNPSGSFQFSITLAGAPSPFVSAGETGEIDASGELDYSFEIVGGSGGAPVTLDLTASLFATSYGDGSAGASFKIEQISGISFVYSSAGTACTFEMPCAVPGADWFASSGGLAVSTKESLYSNTIYEASLVASAADSVGTGGAKGVVDPHFAVDPSTTDAAAYSLAFSPGIGNSSMPAVPEPSTWILLSAGFAGAGLLRFSRKFAKGG